MTVYKLIGWLWLIWYDDVRLQAGSSSVSVTSCYRMAAVRKTVGFFELFHAETVAVKSRSDARKGGGGAHFREKIVEVRWQVEFEDDKFVVIFVNQCGQDGQPTDKCIQWQSLRDIAIMLKYAQVIHVGNGSSGA